MGVPDIGEGYRGVEGRSGYLLRQAWGALRNAMEAALRPHGLTAPQYGALTVLAREPGASGADLARATGTTPQAMNGVLLTMERAGLIERRAHPSHRRILQVSLTEAGRTRLAATRPIVDALEAEIERGSSAAELATVKAWMVGVAQRMEHRG